MLGWCQWLVGKGSDEKSKDREGFLSYNLKHMTVDEVRLIMVDSGWINGLIILILVSVVSPSQAFPFWSSFDENWCIPQNWLNTYRGHLVAQLRSNVSRFEIDFWRWAPGEHHAIQSEGESSSQVGLIVFTPFVFFLRLNIAKPSSLMKDEVLNFITNKESRVSTSSSCYVEKKFSSHVL